MAPSVAASYNDLMTLPHPAHDDRDAAPWTEADELAQIALSAPVPLALDLLVVDPENVRGHDVDTARLHLEQLEAQKERGMPQLQVGSRLDCQRGNLSRLDLHAERGNSIRAMTFTRSARFSTNCSPVDRHSRQRLPGRLSTRFCTMKPPHLACSMRQSTAMSRRSA